MKAVNKANELQTHIQLSSMIPGFQWQNKATETEVTISRSVATEAADADGIGELMLLELELDSTCLDLPCLDLSLNQMCLG